MKLKCFLLNEMVEAKEKVVIPEGGKKYDAYHCDICGIMECHEDRKLVELGGTDAFETSVVAISEVLENQDAGFMQRLIKKWGLDVVELEKRLKQLVL